MASLEYGLRAIDAVQFLAGAVDVIADRCVRPLKDHADFLVSLANRCPAQAFHLAFRQNAVRRDPAFSSMSLNIAGDKAARDL